MDASPAPRSDATVPDNGIASRVVVPADVETALDAEPSARSEFALTPPPQRRAWIDHVEDADEPAERSARVQELVQGLPGLPPLPEAS